MEKVAHRASLKTFEMTEESAKKKFCLLRLRWLHRGAAIVHVRARDIKRRVHIVRLSGQEHGATAASTTEDHFVVNSGCFYPADRTRSLR